MLSVPSALSYGVVPARNHYHSSWNLLISKIVVIPAEAGTPPARFILPGTVFHWEGQPRNRTLMEKVSGNFSSYLLPAFYLCIFDYA